MAFASVIENRHCSIYKPLKVDEIRLLVLQRGRNSDPLRGTLTTLSKVEKDGTKGFEPRFVALSYTWGDQNGPCTIELDGFKAAIGRNLSSALRRVRMGSTECVIWVDALCINQKDDVEKSDQIKDMPTIYESAAFTVIWLGDGFDGVGDAFAWLEKLETLPLTEINYTDMLDAQLDGQIAITLAKLLNLPWWRRAWIIQEAVVSKEAIVMCGSEDVPLRSFMLLASILHLFINTGEISRKECKYSLLMPAGRDLLTLAEIRCSWRPCHGGVQPQDLETLLQRTHLRILAKDPRDRFFALLSISTTEDWLELRPDYTVTREVLFLRATLHLIRKKSSLDVLQMGESLYRSVEDPSWLPGWDQGSRSFTPREPIKGKASEGIKFSLSTSQNLRVITISGAVVGEIVSVSQFSQDQSELPPTLYRHGWLDKLDEFAAITAADPFQLPPSILLLHGLPFSDRRSFVVTTSGHIGFAPDHAQKGDIVTLIGGASTPICLTPVNGYFRWVGSMYVHGAMRGELVESLILKQDSGLTDFEIH